MRKKIARRLPKGKEIVFVLIDKQKEYSAGHGKAFTSDHAGAINTPGEANLEFKPLSAFKSSSESAKAMPDLMQCRDRIAHYFQKHEDKFLRKAKDNNRLAGSLMAHGMCNASSTVEGIFDCGQAFGMRCHAGQELQNAFEQALAIERQLAFLEFVILRGHQAVDIDLTRNAQKAGLKIKNLEKKKTSDWIMFHNVSFFTRALR